ncbi:Multiple C2 and transmembrane domain-containing protein 2 [Orchesella cincta]|uniref:Multiple C2 and transmembrane domain-containing protein 2 n=1 Tax=Orchesella cincta TaxID=48709 RepID=A0A1D2M8Q5_ORCCI|nr:Multiple C2 and transmembrane domain-containing protein 2 [Orchesella cincta]
MHEQHPSELKSDQEQLPDAVAKPTSEDLPGMISPFPFHTLNVHLLRGKNLVAKDACGSSDPYVKVKIGEKLHYKSKTIYRDLNPVWDESFVLPISDLTQPIVFKVFDYDWGFQDDFMGMTSLEASRLPPNKPTELTLTLTETGAPGAESMGDIFINVTLVPRTIEEKDIWFSGDAPGGKLQDKGKIKSQIWSSVLTVLVLEANNLSPGDEKVYMDAFVKFRMGNQKFKTRTLSRVTGPKWLEQFDFYLYDGQPQVLEVQIFDESFSRDYIGRCAIDIGLLEKELTHHKVFQLQESPGEIALLLTISGLAGDSSISDLNHHSLSDDQAMEQRSRFPERAKRRRPADREGVRGPGAGSSGHWGKSDPFVVLELVNSRLQTQTEYRTLTPVWNKIFNFAVRDITNVLEITVYDEDKNHSKEFLGKLDIPLWKIKNKEKKWYMLKDQKLLKPAKGNNAQILLEMELLWNPVRAGIRVMDPPESKFLQGDQKLKRETFLLNIDRLRKIGAKLGVTDFDSQELFDMGVPTAEHHSVGVLRGDLLHIPAVDDPHVPDGGAVHKLVGGVRVADSNGVAVLLPLRYLAMAWGFHKFFRPLIRPNAVPTNEVYNLLLRVPDNPQLFKTALATPQVQFRPLRVLLQPSSSATVVLPQRQEAASVLANELSFKDGY